MTAPRLLDVGEIARMLNARVDAVVRELLPAGERRGHEWVAHCPWRAHKKLGAFSVHLSGQKAGLWSEFSAGEHGDCLDLVARVLFGGDKAGAVRWAKAFLGLADADPAALAAARRTASPPAERDTEAEAEREATRKAAFTIWVHGGQPLTPGDPVHRYLAGRGIPLGELGALPGALRFHPSLWHAPTKRNWPAMVTAITAPNGQFASVHRTWLAIDADGTVTKAPIDPAKMTLGSFGGCAIRLFRAGGRDWKKFAEDETWNITEGIENALSVALVWPECRAVAGVSLSNLSRMALPPAIRTIRLWRDTDDTDGARKMFDRAVAAHQAAGRTVLVAEMPDGIKDANDLLRMSA